MRLLPGLLAASLLTALLNGPGAVAASGPPAAVRSAGTGLSAPSGLSGLSGLLSTQSLLESGVVAEINRVRARAGCRSLVAVSALRVAAGRHSTLMAQRRRLSHRLSGEATLQRRTSAAGYTGATMLGEVIAVGPRSPYRVVRAWLGSAGHRALILDCRFRHLGAGVAASRDGRRWWTVDLGRR